MENFSMLVRHANGDAHIDEFENCRDLIMWYVGSESAEDDIVGAELRVVTDCGEIVTIFIPNDSSTRVSVRCEPPPVRLLVA